jgi:hypothetical protein
LKTVLEFEPDMDQNPFGIRFLGPILDVLDFKQLKWPGHGMVTDHSYQFVEGEYMTAEEYDHFLLDPSDFMMRKYWPRICGALKGFEKLSPLHGMITYYMGIPFGLAPFSLPEVAGALEAIKRAGQESVRIASYSRSYIQKAEEEGFPMQTGAFTQAPFDTLGDFFRGTKGIMLDMYRRPNTLIKACEKLLPIMFETAINATRASGNPRVFIPIHKGLDGSCPQTSSKSSSGPPFGTSWWPSSTKTATRVLSGRVTVRPGFRSLRTFLWEGRVMPLRQQICSRPRRSLAIRSVYEGMCPSLFL